MLRGLSVISRRSLIRFQSNDSANGKEKQKKVAIILSGCGFCDGSDIHESSAAMVHLARLKYEPVCYSLDKPQLQVINHITGEEMGEEKRNILIESARIARGKISPLAELKIEEISGVVFPGGLGVAKNLSTFSKEGVKMTLDTEIEKLIESLLKNKIPQGYMCLSSLLAAKAIKCGMVTLGQDSGEKWPNASAVDAAKQIGARVQNCNVDQVCVDCDNKIISTPAFMYDGQYHEIFDGIGKMVQGLDELIKLGEEEKKTPSKNGAEGDKKK